MRVSILSLLVAVSLVGPGLCADSVAWTDWISASGTSGSAAGLILLPGGPVTVSYAGELSFAELGTGTNYWTEGDPAPYTENPIVSNAPTPSEMLALNYASTSRTLTFSQAVRDPIMAIVSLGRLNAGVSYDFNVPFNVLSEGRGYWGDGSYTLASGDILTGYELHAAIQFQGLVSSITWNSTPSEFWHGITVGVVVPEPSSLGLAAFGLAGVLVRRRRRR